VGGFGGLDAAHPASATIETVDRTNFIEMAPKVMFLQPGLLSGMRLCHRPPYGGQSAESFLSKLRKDNRLAALAQDSVAPGELDEPSIRGEDFMVPLQPSLVHLSDHFRCL